MALFLPNHGLAISPHDDTGQTRPDQTRKISQLNQPYCICSSNPRITREVGAALLRVTTLPVPLLRRPHIAAYELSVRDLTADNMNEESCGDGIHEKQHELDRVLKISSTLRGEYA